MDEKSQLSAEVKFLNSNAALKASSVAIEIKSCSILLPLELEVLSRTKTFSQQASSIKASIISS